MPFSPVLRVLQERVPVDALLGPVREGAAAATRPFVALRGKVADAVAGRHVLAEREPALWGGFNRGRVITQLANIHSMGIAS